VKRAAFVGIGIIGSGLAVNAAMHGYEVRMFYRRDLELQRKRVADIFQIFIDNDVCGREEADELMGSIVFCTDLETVVRDAGIIQESIAERLDAKQALYAQIQDICGSAPIIASSTSELFPSALSQGSKYPERIVVGHPYNPSYLLPVMEICGGQTASEETIQQLGTFYQSWGKVPVVCRKEVPGFIVNSLSWAAMRVCRQQIREGVCSVEDMDKAIMYGPGLRMAVLGQILTMSLGVDGGFRKFDEKYGKPFNPENLVLAEGVDEELAHRPESAGNTEERVKRYRDHMLIEILRLQDLM